jgi:glycogen operon protein
MGREVDWSDNSHHLAYCLRGASQSDRDLYVMINAGLEDLTFTVQEGATADWRRVVDTARPSPADILADEEAEALESSRYLVRARSVVVLLRGVGTRPEL